MNYKEYKDVYKRLLSESGRMELGDDPLKMEKLVTEKIDKFLELYPSVIPKDKNPNAPLYAISLKELYRRTVVTMVDIVDDLSTIISNKDVSSNAEFRRSIFKVFTRPDRRLYVGIWLILLSFVLYFVDSAA